VAAGAGLGVRTVIVRVPCSSNIFLHSHI
jgi:hypothetical protein